MRIRIGIGLALALAGAQAAHAADAAKPTATPKSAPVQLAAAADESARDARRSRAADPVTRAALATPAKRRRTAASLVARIDLSAQRMTVTSNGRTVGSWKISSGRAGYATPPGSFRPKWTSRMHYSRKYNNSPMPYSVFFNGGIATHGTTHQSMLGRPASHGCIRLRTPNARTFYNLVQRHGYKRTRIIVTGRAKQTYAAKPRRRSTTWQRQRRQLRRRRAARRASTNVWGQSYAGSYAKRRRRLERAARYRARQPRRLVFPGDSW